MKNLATPKTLSTTSFLPIFSLPALFLLTLFLGALPVYSAAGSEKIDTRLAASLAVDGQVDALIVFAEQADLRAAATIHGKNARGLYVSQTLRATAERTQGPVLRELTDRELPIRRFWIANMIATRLDAGTAAVLAARPEVARLTVNAEIRAEFPKLETARDLSALRGTLQDVLAGKAGACPPTIEPSLLQVQADDFWDAGFDGRTVVIAGQDTGYDWDHPALRDAYRGWNGVSASHDYHWHDAIHSGGGICGPDSPEPCDDFGHGTHTMGTMVGDAPGVRVGVAPGARWIGCRNMDQGNGTVATYSECFEWFVAPTRLDGTAPDPSMAPHIVNNSWSCPPSEGCGDPEVLRTVVENVRAAGILVVTSAGNSGSSCSSISTPTAIYDASLTVGSVNAGDTIASSSSRGPVTIDGSGRLKPDLSAPGISICSTTPGSGYGSSSGTSMAAPHVAGMAALLIAAAPCWEGDVDALEEHLIDHASPQTSGQTCGGIPGTQIPNNTYGHGSLRGVLPTACVPVFVDGFESGDSSFWTSP